MLGLGYLAKEANYKPLQIPMFLPVSVAQVLVKARKPKTENNYLFLKPYLAQGPIQVFPPPP